MYDNNIEELFDLKLGSMTTKAREKFFLELLNYLNFIKEEKVNIQRFLSSLAENERLVTGRPNFFVTIVFFKG